MGLSLTVSLQKKLSRAVPRRTLVIQIIRRSLTFIFLGIVINSSKHLLSIAHLRFPGVLQRIGVAYFIVGILEVAFTKRLEIEVRRHKEYNNNQINGSILECIVRK